MNVKSSYAKKAEIYLPKTVLFHRQDDKRIIDWFDTQPNASESIRRAIYFYLNHRQRPEDFDPTAIAGSVDSKAIVEAVSQVLLPEVRQIVQVAVETALAGVALAPARHETMARYGTVEFDEVEDLADQFDLELVLD